MPRERGAQTARDIARGIAMGDQIRAMREAKKAGEDAVPGEGIAHVGLEEEKAGPSDPASASQKITPAQVVEAIRESIFKRLPPAALADFLIDNAHDRYIGDTCTRLMFLYAGQPAPPTAGLTINITARYDPSELLAARQAAIDGQCRLLGPGDATDIADGGESAE